VTYSDDRLTVTTDLSYSQSHRTELQKATNMRSSRAWPMSWTARRRRAVGHLHRFRHQRSGQLPHRGTPTSNTNYARYRLVTDRHDEIAAARIDVTYDLGDGFFQSIKVGRAACRNTAARPTPTTTSTWPSRSPATA
jgi:iron complex outermembrane receptor protein